MAFETPSERRVDGVHLESHVDMPTPEDSNSLSATPIGSNGPSTDSTPIGSSNPSTPIEESHSPTTQAIAGDEDEESAGSRGYATIHEDMDNETDENESDSEAWDEVEPSTEDRVYLCEQADQL